MGLEVGGGRGLKNSDLECKLKRGHLNEANSRREDAKAKGCTDPVWRTPSGQGKHTGQSAWWF